MAAEQLSLTRYGLQTGSHNVLSQSTPSPSSLSCRPLGSTAMCMIQIPPSSPQFCTVLAVGGVWKTPVMVRNPLLLLHGPATALLASCLLMSRKRYGIGQGWYNTTASSFQLKIPVAHAQATISQEGKSQDEAVIEMRLSDFSHVNETLHLNFY